MIHTHPRSQRLPSVTSASERASRATAKAGGQSLRPPASLAKGAQPTFGLHRLSESDGTVRSQLRVHTGQSRGGGADGGAGPWPGQVEGQPTWPWLPCMDNHLPQPGVRRPGPALLPPNPPIYESHAELVPAHATLQACRPIVDMKPPPWKPRLVTGQALMFLHSTTGQRLRLVYFS